ncbi:MAG: NAD(P)-dependent oxidoreductase [Gammaproteobacteria bacterium]|nr:NAD(P)-dependent oxidoreductase [Gammaproteobacteria bacterium]
MFNSLILGANGFIGRNLVDCLGEQPLITVSRSAKNHAHNSKHYSIDLSNNIISGNHPLFSETPNRIYILARPDSLGYDINRVFHTNLQLLLMKWCDNIDLESIYFVSSTMVYDCLGHKPRTNAPDDAEPWGMYEYFKLETELFLKYISNCLRTNVSIEVLRIPLGFSGITNAASNSNQFIYHFIDSYRQGLYWDFRSDEARKYGSSWVHVPDLAVCITKRQKKVNSGYRIVNVSSGYFSYHQLDQFFIDKLKFERKKEMRLYRSNYQIVDQLNLPQRDLLQEIENVL